MWDRPVVTEQGWRVADFFYCMGVEGSGGGTQSKHTAKPLSLGLRAGVQRSALAATSCGLNSFLQHKDIQDH